jgi:PAS domain S-box-containing protein
VGLALVVDGRRQGTVWFQVSVPGQWAIYLPYAANAVSLLALHVEKRRQTGKLRALNQNLDEQVALQTTEIEQQKARLELVLRSAELGTWDWNVQTGEVRYDERWAEMLGYRLEEIAPGYQGWERLLHPEDKPHVIETLAAHLEGKTAGYEVEQRLHSKSGKWVWVLAKGRVIERDAAGRPLRACGTHQDISERKRGEEEKAALQAQLNQAQKMESIGRLAGGVAHDFNNLLTVINGYADLALVKLSAGDPLRTGLVEIRKAGEHAAALTRQLLAFSRQQVLQPRKLDLNRIVADMRPLLERLVGEDVEVRVELEAGNAMVHADPHQLGQVIMNLAVNARDAMPNGGRLRIKTANEEWDKCQAETCPDGRAGRYVTLAVSDNGEGMNESTRQRIFDPFFTTKTIGQGTGLGLSMVQGIVAQSNGFINVVSEPNQGTTFKIYLPLSAEAAAEATQTAELPAAGGKETVLVVEDEPGVRDYTAEALRTYGYHVIKAENAGEALLICEQKGERIHLVLTDVVMPHVNGPELAGRLEKLQPGIKVLFMSGYTGKVADMGAEHIQKPFSPEQLATRVRAVLARTGKLET